MCKHCTACSSRPGVTRPAGSPDYADGGVTAALIDQDSELPAGEVVRPISEGARAALTAAYVTQMKRTHAQNTRGIATPEQMQAWADEAHAIIRQVQTEAILMDSFDGAVTDRLSDAGYTEYAEDEDGGVTWVSAPLSEVLLIVRTCATEYETGDSDEHR